MEFELDFKVLTQDKLYVIEDSNITIFGAGETGAEFLVLLKKLGISPRFIRIVDSFKTGEIGTPFGTFEIITPNDFFDNVDSDLVIITSIFWDEIINIFPKNFEKDILILGNQIIHSGSHLSNLGDFLFPESTREEYARNFDKILHFYPKESDKELLTLIYELRSGGSEIHFFDEMRRILKIQNTKYSNINKYLGKLDISKIDIAIEGGVYDGTDTVLILRELSPKAKIFAFEPLLVPLKVGPNSWIANHKRCNIIEKALWSTNGTLNFNNRTNGMANAHIEYNKDLNNPDHVEIECVSIDNFFQFYTGTKIFLKLDVEGAELEILAGSKITILNNEVSAAISMYHKSSDMFKIPEILLSINPNYQFSFSVSNPTFIDWVITTV